MISTVHCRAHKIYSACINTNILFVDVLFMNCLCHQCAVRSHHKSAHLSINGDISHSCRYKDLVKLLVNALSDLGNIISDLIRLVRDSYAT